MNPRNDRPFLRVAILALFLLGLCPAWGSATALPIDGGVKVTPPVGIVDPPTQGGGTPTDGGDPDEVVIFIVSPGNPGVATSTAQYAPTVSVKLSAILAEWRTLLFWAGVAR